MNIRITLLGQARSAIGHSSDVIECPDCATVSLVLQSLAQKLGDALHRILLDEQNNPQSSVMLFVNDEQVFSPQTHVLFNGDSLTVMPPISGG